MLMRIENEVRVFKLEKKGNFAASKALFDRLTMPLFQYCSSYGLFFLSAPLDKCSSRPESKPSLFKPSFSQIYSLANLACLYLLSLRPKRLKTIHICDQHTVARTFHCISNAQIFYAQNVPHSF